MEAKLEANPHAKNGGTDVFEKGDYETDHITVKASEEKNAKASKGKRVKEASLPVDVFIVTPKEKGTYPVLLFCHGWMMKNDWYSDLFDHIASHGYIIVAPQFYSQLWEINFSIPEEIERAKAVLEWLPTGIAAALKEKDYDVYPDENNLVVTGHSRGGKVAFALALGENDEKIRSKKRKATPLTVSDPPPQKFKAVIGIDPVGGSSSSTESQDDPKILQYIPRCFKMSIPVAVVGAGLSNQSKVLGKACAPNGVNHSEFFNESKPPVCYFLATEYGHLDMVNDSHVGLLETFVAKRGKEGTYDLMRSTTGGIVVAFLRAYLGDEDDDLKAIVDDPSIAPVLLDPVIHIADVK